MPTVNIQLPPGTQVNSANRKVTLTDNLGHPVTLPVTSPSTDLGELAPKWAQVPAPGLVAPPFTVRGPRPLRVVTLTVTIVDPANTLNTVDDTINSLYTILNMDTITLAYGSFESTQIVTGGFVCTSFKPKITVRDPVTNNAIQATATIELTEANHPPVFTKGT